MKIRKVEKSLDDLAEKYETDLSSLEKQRKEIILKARQEADQILSEANKRIENTIREIRENQADKEKTKQIRAKLVEFKQEIDESAAVQDEFINQKIQKLKEKESRRNEKRAEKKPAESKEKEQIEEPDVWKAGDKVIMAGNQNVGEILELN